LGFCNKPNLAAHLHRQSDACYLGYRGYVLEMKAGAKRILMLIAGWAFIALGIVGLVLPFLQGILFIAIGLIILSSQYVWAKVLLEKLRKRFPKLGAVADKGAAKADLWMKRLSGQGSGD
jgi:uncharacterized protein